MALSRGCDRQRSDRDLRLKASDGFSRAGPSLVVVAGYGLAFFFLSLTLRTMPVGVAYAIWSGVGVALIALIGWLVFGQALDPPAIVGMVLIVAGVVSHLVSPKTLPDPIGCRISLSRSSLLPGYFSNT